MIGPNLHCMLFGSAGVVLEFLDSLFKASWVVPQGVRFGFDLFLEQQSNQDILVRIVLEIDDDLVLLDNFLNSWCWVWLRWLW